MNKYFAEAQAMQSDLTACRRDLHHHPETGWTEFRTAAKIIGELKRLGFEVKYGDQVLDSAEMMGLPAPEVLTAAMKRAVQEGADASLVQQMAGGKTGVVGVLKLAHTGRTIAMRFDMDCNDVQEADDQEHRPSREGFASLHEREMHACGHDGHVTIGLAVARLAAAHRAELAGTLKLIFQPAEEGVRGARAMAVKGVVDDVDYFFGGHIGFIAREPDMLICATGGFLATTKLDARFTGRSSHAGAAPQEGRNALLAAAAASLALHSIPRHGEGASRINVGVLNAGTGRNVVPDTALMKLETRGATTAINDFMAAEADRMLKAAALMYHTEVKITQAGSAPSCVSEQELGREIAALAEKTGIYTRVVPYKEMGGSEDCAYFMERVQQHGGHAVYLGYGTPIAAGHHNRRFDFDERCLWQAAGILMTLLEAYGLR